MGRSSEKDLKPMKHRILLSLVVFTQIIVMLSRSQCYAQVSKASQEDDIREAVVRYQIANWDLRADVFFLGIQSKDPTVQFLSRFADITKPVRKKSLSTEEKKVMKHVTEKRTYKFGVIFDQETIKWDGESVAEVEGGYYCGSFCGAGGTYRVEQKSNRWIVTQFKVSIIS